MPTYSTIATLATTNKQLAKSGSTIEWIRISSSLSDTDSGDYSQPESTVISDDPRMTNIQLIKSGLFAGTDKGNNRQPNGTSINYGGTSDLWGTTWTPTTANGIGIGIAYSNTLWLVFKGFNFNIPQSATITGITATVKDSQVVIGGYTYAALDYIKLTITYTWNIEAIGEGIAYGSVYITPSENVKPVVNPKKNRIILYNETNRYLLELDNDIISQISLKEELNTIGGGFDFEIAVTEGNKAIYKEASRLLKVGCNIKYTVYYGYIEPILDNNYTPILDNNFNWIDSQSGVYDGLDKFFGYIEKIEYAIGGDTVKVSCVPKNKELNDILHTSIDAVLYNASTQQGIQYKTLRGNSGIKDYSVSLTFTSSVTQRLSKIKIQGNISQTAKDLVGSVKITAEVYAGTDPIATGTLVASSYAYVSSTTKTDINFVFTGNYYTVIGDYYVIFRTDYDGGAEWLDTPPVKLYVMDDVSGGTLSDIYISQWDYTFGGYVWQLANINQSYFTVYYNPNNTYITFNSYDPSQIVRDTIEQAINAGLPIYYTSQSIANTGTTVSYTFNNNTLIECLNKCVELAPMGWYFKIDQGTGLVTFKPKSNTVSKYLTIDKDIVSGTITESIEEEVTQVNFTGGGDPALNRIKTNTSKYKIRKALKKMVDIRVTNNSTADIISQGELDLHGEPDVFGKLVFTDINSTYFNEDITTGETIQIINTNDFYQTRKFIIFNVEYKVDTVIIALEKKEKRISKRIQDIKRNLQQKEFEKNNGQPTIT